MGPHPGRCGLRGSLPDAHRPAPRPRVLPHRGTQGPAAGGVPVGVGADRHLAGNLRQAGFRPSQCHLARYRAAVRRGRALPGGVRIRAAPGIEPSLRGPLRLLRVDPAAGVPLGRGPRGGRPPPRVRGAALRDGGRHRRTRHPHGGGSGAVGGLRRASARLPERAAGFARRHLARRTIPRPSRVRVDRHPAAAGGGRDHLRGGQRKPRRAGRGVSALRPGRRAHPRGGGLLSPRQQHGFARPLRRYPAADVFGRARRRNPPPGQAPHRHRHRRLRPAGAVPLHASGGRS